MSTDEVWISGRQGAFEETRYDRVAYSASKAAAITGLGGLSYEPGCDLELLNNWPIISLKTHSAHILNAVHGKPLPVYGAGANVRDWLYVDDHARALDLIVAGGRIGEKYNVGGRNERRNIDVVRRICAILDDLRPRPSPHDALISFVADRPGHDLRYAIDAAKLERELGWRAHETFESGIEKTVRWYLDNEWWWRPLRDKVYAANVGVIAEARHNPATNRDSADERHHSAAQAPAASIARSQRSYPRQTDDLLSARSSCWPGSATR